MMSDAAAMNRTKCHPKKRRLDVNPAVGIVAVEVRALIAEVRHIAGHQKVTRASNTDSFTPGVILTFGCPTSTNQVP